MSFVTVVVGLAVLATLVWARPRRKGLPLPPGPPPSLIVGNIKDIPKVKEWEAYAQMGKTYGPVVHLKVFHKHLIIVNSAAAAEDLFEAKGVNWSDRPQFVMLNELMGWSWNPANMHYGPKWLEHRTVLQQYFHQNAQERFMPLQHRTNFTFLQALVDTPDRFALHVRRLTAQNIMKTAYGIHVEDETDPYVALADEAVASVARGALPGSYLVDWIPILKYVPAWFPGAQFQRDAAEWRVYPDRMLNVPFDKVQADMAAGLAKPSLVSELLEEHETNGSSSEEVIKACAGIAFLGGGDTTVSIIMSFILMMIVHPDIQSKAQAEIDAVVGGDRLPELSDRLRLPYLSAVLRETFRRFPVVPLGVPRRVMADDEYKGMHIPGGATVLSNIWAMLHDDEVYPDPLAFNPERWLKHGEIDASVPDRSTMMFGFGRRICPGRHFADSSVWLAYATLLACFTMRKPANGPEPSQERRSGAVSSPVPFACSFTLRSKNVAMLIQQGLDSD